MTAASKFLPSEEALDVPEEPYQPTHLVFSAANLRPDFAIISLIQERLVQQFQVAALRCGQGRCLLLCLL